MLSAAASFALVACGNSDKKKKKKQRTKVEWNVNNLSPLDKGNYEGWLVGSDGKVHSTGKFDINAKGNLVDKKDKALDDNVFKANSKVDSPRAAVITVEPKNDSNKGPSNSKFLAGEFSGGSADLTVGDSRAIGSSFDGAETTYILATPTNGDGTNEKAGIWFLDPSGGSKSRGLNNNAPDLTDVSGWTYEGWVVFETSSGNMRPVSTGKFDNPNKADEAAPYSGSQMNRALGFPGEDFLKNAPSGLSFPQDLNDHNVVISVEPKPDPTEKPFALKPIAGSIPSDAGDHEALTIGSGVPKPSATASLP
ncbi:MAG: hypothetical protein ABEL76_04375 [Bradymonadaceae bacterium]